MTKFEVENSSCREVERGLGLRYEFIAIDSRHEPYLLAAP